MNLFIKCKSCNLPVIVTNKNPLCPFCKRKIRDLEEGYNDGFGLFIEEYQEKEYFEWEDIQKLIYSVEYLTEINNKVCRQLGEALIELDKCKKRLEWYRKATFGER